MRNALLCAAMLAMTSLPAHADEVTDSLQNAMDAYQSGDLKYALDELDYAKQLMLKQKTDALGKFLPDAPQGWTREINKEMNAGLAMMGGGVGAEAEYRNEDGQSFTITIMADNPMVAAMAGMIGNAALLGAEIHRIGRAKFMIKDDEANGLIDQRILVKGTGDDMDRVLATLETMDFRALAKFGR